MVIFSRRHTASETLCDTGSASINGSPKVYVVSKIQQCFSKMLLHLLTGRRYKVQALAFPNESGLYDLDHRHSRHVTDVVGP